MYLLSTKWPFGSLSVLSLLDKNKARREACGPEGGCEVCERA
ncbi:hypothetical protein HMPREF3036_01254 [Sutterella sp. KLE1602]|nr:hypothetical protein HMPREF3036_01254 [Sutterella sp. KLE1602]